MDVKKYFLISTVRALSFLLLTILTTGILKKQNYAQKNSPFQNSTKGSDDLSFDSTFNINQPRSTKETEIKTTVFIRFRVTKPLEQKFIVDIGGFRHAGDPDWYFPKISTQTTGGVWSDWIDLSSYQWHEQMKRSGGVAEYPSLKLSATFLESSEPLKNAAFEVQLADAPSEKSIVINFKEQSESDSIGFLVPIPLREKAKEFETGTQMTARHARWAKEAIGKAPIKLKNFDIITALWDHYDPALAQRESQTLYALGFNVLGNIDYSISQKIGIRPYGHTWLYDPDPESVEKQWRAFSKDILAKELATETGRQKYKAMSHWVISDEVSALDFRNVNEVRLNRWFQDYLKNKGVTEDNLGKALEQIQYPAAAMHENALPHNAPLAERRLLYYAVKFGHWWSAKQLRQTSDFIQSSLPGMPTETLLPSHGFLGNAWGPANVGMSYRMLDIFELSAQQSVNQMSAEDWLGLNHMYGPEYTWSGGQTFGYYNALIRSAIGTRPIMLRGLITPSDDKYLQLKAYSSLGQGAKSFFFWTFGPTFIGTENYWSDLRSQYDGIAKLNRTLEKVEDILYPAKPVTDQVAILYSVSHDIWNTGNHSAFVEKRLLWHALRHLQIQPDFVREEDIEAGKLKNYKALYIVDWNISRKTTAEIDRWVKNGGTVYLSAGAATRDEFNEPFSPPFAAAVWEDNAAQKLITEQHAYNERIDLPKIKPLTEATVQMTDREFKLPVIGNRLNMRQSEKPIARFADEKTAGQIISYNRGSIVAFGFMPMLAYGQLANFKPTTLEEKWTPEARQIIRTVLDIAKIDPIIKTDVPVIEVNLLTGIKGSAVVLANYTYQPIKDMTIDLKISHPVNKAISSSGEKIQIINKSNGSVRIKTDLKWTDILLLTQ